jgi:hypothetical protein
MRPPGKDSAGCALLALAAAATPVAVLMLMLAVR